MAKFCPNCGNEMVDEAAIAMQPMVHIGILIKIMKKNLLQVVKRKKDYLLGLLF